MSLETKTGGQVAGSFTDTNDRGMPRAKLLPKHNRCGYQLSPVHFDFPTGKQSCLLDKKDNKPA